MSKLSIFRFAIYGAKYISLGLIKRSIVPQDSCQVQVSLNPFCEPSDLPCAMCLAISQELSCAINLLIVSWSSGRHLPQDQEVPGSSPGCARLMLNPWKRLFTCISSLHSCVKRVPDYRQYVRVMHHL